MGGGRPPAVLAVAVVVGLLVVFNGAFFVAAYFPGSCRACHYLDPYGNPGKARAPPNVSGTQCPP